MIGLLAVLHLFCWDPSAGASGYHLYTSDTPCGAWLTVTDTASTCVEVEVPDPLPGDVSYFIVTAHNNLGESETEHTGACSAYAPTSNEAAQAP